MRKAKDIDPGHAFSEPKQRKLKYKKSGNIAVTTGSFFENPILNSPYGEPSRNHPLDAEGQPLSKPPRDGRRKSELITPVPKPRKRKRKNTSKDQGRLDLHSDGGVSSNEQEYNPTP